MYKKKCFSGNGNPCAVKPYSFCYWYRRTKWKKRYVNVMRHLQDISVYARRLLKYDKGSSGLTTELMLKSGVVAVTPVRREGGRKKRGEDPLRFIMLGHLLRR